MVPLHVVAIPNGLFEENCYLLGIPGGTEAVIIDPGEEPDRFLDEARRHGWTISAIWLTHAHIDHIMGVEAVARATGAPIHLHPHDRPIYDALVEQGQLFGFDLTPAPPPDAELRHGQRLRLGDYELEVRHVPGHSPGHVCFVGDGFVLGGDVLFQGSIGRTDLMGGDLPALLAGIRTQLFVLPEDTTVFPGHGPSTTIGRERATNPFLIGTS
ncbi:MAG TPA: MBL fold metallo-hydrolase [Gemmatimonadales bacterium]|nr:MBL fold metallo-hydrolase [Gemmatimonadales bacterium]